MIQTGDPFGDGTGGESIWGHDFEVCFEQIHNVIHSCHIVGIQFNVIE